MVFERDTAINNNNNTNNTTAINSNINSNVNQLHQYRYSDNDTIDVEKGLTNNNNNKDLNNINNTKPLDNNTTHDSTKYNNINSNNKSSTSIDTLQSNNYNSARKSSFKHFYYRYINPWFKVLILALIIMYVYSVLLSIVTYRNNRFQDDLANVPRSAITFPLNDDGYRPFILPDLLFDVINPANPNSAGYKNWKLFIDISAALFNIAFVILVAIRRDIIRFAEYVMYQLTIFFIMYFTKTFTTHPAASGIDPSCYNQTFHSFGSWIATTLTFDYCGDQMFSGHTVNVLLPMIMLKRLMWDIIGWNFKRYHDVQFTLNNNNTLNPNDNYRNDNMYNNMGVNYNNNNNVEDNNTENEDWFFHVFEVNDSPNWVKNHTTAVWITTILIRFFSWFWFGLFIYALLHIRQHYTSDIAVAIVVVILLTTNTKISQSLVRWAYKPNYNNYVKNGFFHQVKLKHPRNREQINYEQRIERVGQGGVI